MARLFALLVLILGLLSFDGQIFASEPVVLANPSNNSTVSTTKLTWEIPSYSLYTTNPYRIQVDNDSDFSSTYRDYTTKNAYYTPSLYEGTWFWRVKVKDSNASWSEWSESWSFILLTTAPTPTPQPEAGQPLAETPSPSPSPVSSFTLSNTPPQINSDESFMVNINLFLPDNPNSKFFLKGAFKKSDSSNYFGFTKVIDAWIKNSDGATNQLPISTDSSGNWTGNLNVQPDEEDSGFTGSGDYIFKVGRYNETGTGLTWSNETTINIKSNPSPSPVNNPPQNPTNPTIIASPSIKPSNKPATTPKLSSLNKISTNSYTLGISTKSATIASFSEKLEDVTPEKNSFAGNNIKKLSIISGVIIILASIGWYLRFKYKNVQS